MPDYQLLMIQLVLFTFTLATEYRTNGNQLTCVPFGALILWDRSTNNDAFDIQRHYVARIITNTPENTNISLYTAGRSLKHITDFVRVAENDSNWVDSISRINHRMCKQIISYKKLIQVISKENEKTEETSQQIFFVIDMNSKIYNEEKTKKKLSKFKVFVVYYGTKPLSMFWTNLATDKNHLLKVSNKEPGDTDAFLQLSCHDSRLYCDTDMYWNGTACHRCSFICSRVPSEYCQIECPYFDEFTQDVHNTKNHQTALDRSFNIPLLTLITLVLILQIAVLVNSYMVSKKIQDNACLPLNSNVNRRIEDSGSKSSGSTETNKKDNKDGIRRRTSNKLRNTLLDHLYH